MNGVAHNVEIMALRAVPDGDEYDKDIALAIRYAADNGAKLSILALEKTTHLILNGYVMLLFMPHLKMY